MPKEPPVERFRLWINDVPASEVGPTAAMLSRQGYKVGFELIEDVKTFAKRTNHELSSEELLRAFIADHPTFKAIEAVKHFEANGRTKGSTYPALGVLVEKKVLKKLDPGNYARADVKHLAAPKKKAKAPSANRYEVSHVDFILRAARRAHGRFSVSKIKDLFEKDGRGRDSVSSALAALVERKLIKRVSEGEYVLQNTMAEKPETKTNGNGAVEAAHG